MSSYLATNRTNPSGYLLNFLAFALIQTVCYAFFRIILYPCYLSPLRRLPSAKQPPLHKRFYQEPLQDKLGRWAQEVPNEGLIRYFGLFNQERILITRVQGCKDVLNTQAYKYIKFPWALEVMGQFGPQGILVAPPKKHKVDRKLLQPAFKAPYIKSLFPIFWDQSAKFLKVIEKQLQGNETGVIDIGGMLNCATLDIVSLTSFGGSLDSISNPDSSRTRPYRNIFSAKKAHFIYRLWAFALPSWIYRRLPVTARYEIDSACKSVRQDLLPLINERRKLAQVSDQPGKSEIHSKGDIIATLLRSNHDLSDNYLVDQCLDFLVAGQETTAVATVFTLYALSQNPEMQSRLRRDIRSQLISPELDSSFGNADVESIPYLVAVCNESLRLYAPVPDARRMVAESGAVVQSVPIPIGTVVNAVPWLIHRAKDIWGPDAEEFNPDRWLVPDPNRPNTLKIEPLGGSGDPFAVMTFTYGPRACIGEKFARGEMLTLVAHLIGRFDWKFKGIGRKGDREMKLAFGVTLAPVGGAVSMFARKVEGW